MRRALAAVLLLAAPATAQADVVFVGRGFGHGVGFSQYGAYGLAKFEGRDFRSILSHYYTGTTVREVPAVRVRVRLRSASRLTVDGATRARGADGRRRRLNPRRPYRLQASGALVRVSDARTGRTKVRLASPARVTGGASVRMRGRAENERVNGLYRGALLVHADGRLLAVNDVAMKHYLYGVVPAEMPTTWHPEAVRAQAVAARSYAMRSLRPAEPFDVYADTRSQVYGGLLAETPGGNDAVRATDDLVVHDGREIAQTLFHSTSGGRTAANEEAFPLGSPVAYLRSVEDPYDHISPYHTWTARFTRAQIEDELAEVLEGGLVDIDVISKTPSGRAAIVRVTGTRGEQDVAAAEIRRLLGLRSTWFQVSRD